MFTGIEMELVQAHGPMELTRFDEVWWDKLDSVQREETNHEDMPSEPHKAPVNSND